MFWWRVIDCLLESGVTTKETLLSFANFVCDPERAVGPAQVLRGSCWVRSQMEEGGAGGTNDLVKVKGRGSGVPGLKPLARDPPVQVQ